MKMITYNNPQRSKWAELLKRPQFEFSGLYEKVRTILDEIRQSGDAALQKYTKQFDAVELDNFLVSEKELEEAAGLVSSELKQAMQLASANIEKFHSAQKPEIKKIETTPGVTCWQKAVAIEKVGLYIPGGTAPLFSTVLMLAIPARIAGCKEITLCTPPAKNGKIHPAILYAAKISGVKTIYKLGGVQAIGAMAFGTESVLKVNKIFGPGNQFVTAAKQLVSMKDVSIDMPAGPSEVMVVADESANPAFVASDLLSQAEHGTDSQVILLANSQMLVHEINEQINIQLEKLPRKEMAKKSLANSLAIILKDKQDTIDMINEYAPEHLILCTEDYPKLAEKVINAGSVFLGNYTPESAGDYASGTNHTLPTNGWAKTYSGVNLDSFMKKITFQELKPGGLKIIGPAIEIMAATEQLEAHKNAVSLRLKY